MTVLLRKSRNRFPLHLATGEPTTLRPANAMPSKDLKETRHEEHIVERHSKDSEATPGPDAEFGGTEARKELERKLLLKLDVRMSVLVVIYILNYVSCTLQWFWTCVQMLTLSRLIGIMRGECGQH